MKSINIKGKPYVTVNERLKFFRNEEAFEGWQLITTILHSDSDVCLIRADVINTDGIIMATGHAYEESSSTFINKTSHVENCETSAIGRALGNLGIGIDDSVATFEEVATAITNQDNDKKWLSDKQFSQAVDRLNNISEVIQRKDFVDKIYGEFKVKRDYRKQLDELVLTKDIPGL